MSATQPGTRYFTTGSTWVSYSAWLLSLLGYFTGMGSGIAAGTALLLMEEPLSMCAALIAYIGWTPETS